VNGSASELFGIKIIPIVDCKLVPAAGQGVFPIIGYTILVESFYGSLPQKTWNVNGKVGAV